MTTSYGRLGVVERPLNGELGIGRTLRVRTGLLRTARIEIDVSDIEWIIPQGRRIVLRTGFGVVRGKSGLLVGSSGAGAGKATDDREEALCGYAVITIDGDRVGTVAGSDGELLVIARGRWLWRQHCVLPRASTVVRDADWTVLMLAPEGDLQRVSARLRGGRSVGRRARAGSAAATAKS